MLIGNKIFPYPILNNNKENSGYKSSIFLFDFKREDEELIKRDGNIILEDLHFELNNEELNLLYNNNLLEVVCIVECSNTVFRKIIPLKKEPQTIPIPIKDLSNKVTISAYGYAKKDIPSFQSKDFIDDYMGYSFDIEQNEILLADDGFRFHVDLDEIDDNKMSSIFNIVRKDDAGEEVSYLDEDNKISIYLSPEHYKQYDQMKRNSQFNNVFFAMLVIPVLSSCIKEIQSFLTTDDSLDELAETKKWFRSIQRRFKNMTGSVLDTYELKNVNSYVFAQQMMNYSTGSGLDDYYNMAFNVGEEDSDE